MQEQIQSLLYIMNSIETDKLNNCGVLILHKATYFPFALCGTGLLRFFIKGSQPSVVGCCGIAWDDGAL